MSEEESESEEHEIRRTPTKRYAKRPERYSPHDIVNKVPPKPKPDGPKRPMGAYFLYVRDVMPSLREKNPNLKVTELTKRIAEDWKNKLSQSEKQKYQDEGKAQFEEYREKRKKYVASWKYKKYRKALADWKELYQDEYEELEYEKAMKREANKNKKKAKAKSQKKKRTSTPKEK